MLLLLQGHKDGDLGWCQAEGNVLQLHAGGRVSVRWPGMRPWCVEPVHQPRERVFTPAGA